MTPKEKMIQARKTLGRHRDIEEARLRAADKNNHPDITVTGDAIAIGCKYVDSKQLKKHPDWHCYSDAPLKRKAPEDYLPYARIARFQSTKTQSKFWHYYEQLGDRLPQNRIVLYPDDHTGLLFQEISSVLENVKGDQIARLEVALNFGIHTGVDSRFIRKHFISGKCKVDSANTWGRRNGTKYIRSYFKRQIGAHRLELQLNWRFVRENKIDDVFDIQKLAQLLPDRHILFAEIDEEKVTTHLHKDWTAARTVELLRRLHSLEGNLLEQLGLLRETAQLKNTRRLLKSLPINQRITKALKEWTSQWPTAPSRLRRKP